MSEERSVCSEQKDERRERGLHHSLQSPVLHGGVREDAAEQNNELRTTNHR
jgi:hypothetical protein